MIKNLAIYFAAAASALLFFSCNEKTEEVEQTSTSAAVKAFSLAANDNVLAHLDSVKFSIDLVRGQIFNADSLPKGTRVDSLVPVITTLNGCKVAEFTMTRPGKADSVVDFVANSKAAIDFTRPVKLRIVSPDGLVTRTYTVKVNVHLEDADSLMWSQLDRRTLPSKFPYPDAQHTVRRGNHLVCLTAFQGAYCVATLRDDLSALAGKSPDLGTWSYADATFPAAVDINTFSATDDALYILAADGSLLSSTDGAAWTSTGRIWRGIYGNYSGTLLGAAERGSGNYVAEAYPGTAVYDLAPGMPVAAASAPVYYSFTMSDTPQMLIVGGRRADGSLSRDTYGFDGASWAKVSRTSLPAGLEAPAVAPYFTVKTSTGWNTTDLPTMVAFGGRLTDGSINTRVYISDDYGFTWREGSSKYQLPAYMPALYHSQVFVITAELGDAAPKVVKPTTSWPCPYIYLFGGINAEGQTSANVWRGVLNQLSFKPLD